MSSNHPTFHERCCEPFRRITPSGRVESFHSLHCKVAPNKVMPREQRTGVVVAGHKYDTCRIPNCITCAYIERHLDDEDDVRNGGFA